MAYFLTNNLLDDATITFAVGGEDSEFTFAKCFDGNPSTGFKPSTNSTTILLHFSGNQSISAVGLFNSRDSAITLTLSTATTADLTDVASGDWTEMTFDKSGQNNLTSPSTTVSVASGRSSFVGIDDTVSNVRSIKIEFSGLSPTDDVLNHLFLSSHVEIDISHPYMPPMFQLFETTMKRNNNGNPLVSDKFKAPSKLTFNIKQKTQTEMKTIVNSLGDLYKPFMVSTSYDLTSETKGNAYYCILDKNLAQPKYTNPTVMSWQIKVLGYV